MLRAPNLTQFRIETCDFPRANISTCELSLSQFWCHSLHVLLICCRMLGLCCALIWHLSFWVFSNSSAQCNKWFFTVNSNAYFRKTQSQNPLAIENSSSLSLQRAQSAWIIFFFLSRITNMSAAPIAISFASSSCLSSSSHDSTCTFIVILDFFCGDHFLTLPLHNNDTKIEMDNDQSYASTSCVEAFFLDVVLLSYLQTRPTHQRYPRFQSCFQCHLLESPVLQAEVRPSEKKKHPMILTNPSVSVIAP